MTPNVKFTLLTLLCTLNTAAYGYIDPGSGSLLLQILMVAFTGVVFYFSNALSFVKRILGIGKGPDEHASDE